MAAIVAVAATDNWNANGSWVGGVQPTAADDVTIVAGATVTIPSGVTALARSVTVAASGALAFAATTSVLTIGDASGGAFTNSGTITLTAIGTINFVSTSSNGGAGWGLTTGGQTMPNITVNGVGNKIVPQDALTATGATITLTAGTLDTNSKSVTAGAFSSNNSNVRTLTLGSTVMTLTGGGTPWNITTATSLTITANTATITLSAGAIVIAPGANVNYNGASFVITGSNIPVWNQSGCTVANLTRTGTASKVDQLQFNGNLTITGTLTLNSNSSVNRLLIQSATPGTPRTITAAAVVMTNVVDFMDITGAGAATWTVAATGATFLGDAGGNSGITFTTPATQTHTASAGGNWSDVTKWTSRVPLPQDNVVIDVNTTGTITMDMPRAGADLTFTGFAGTVSWAAVTSVNGSLTLASGMTNTSTFNLTFTGRGTHTVTSAGKTFLQSVFFQGPGSTYTLQDALSLPAGNLVVSDGTFTTNNQSVTCLTFSAQSARATTLNFGSSTITLTSTANVTVFGIQANLTTFNAGTSNIVIATASVLQRSVLSQSTKTFASITYTVASSPGSLFLSSTPGGTIGTLNVGSGRGLQFTSGATFTVTNWNVNGAANGYLYLPGVAGNNVSTPDSAAVSITGDQEYIVRASMDALVPTNSTYLGGKWQGIAGGEAWRWGVNTTGALVFVDSTDGTNTVYNAAMASTAQMAAAITAGVTFWWRLTIQTNSGGKRVVTAYYAPDNVAVPTVWTQLGGVLNTVTAANYIDTTGPFEIGGFQGGTQPWQGRMYRAILRNGIGGTVALDVDLTRSLGSAGWLDAAKTQFTESSVNAATVTVNGALAQAGDGRVLVTSSTPGTAATVAKVAGTAAVMADYLSVQDSTATGGLWVDGPHYANVSGNTGWTFADAIPSDTDTGAGSDVDSPISITDTDTGASSDVDGGIGATLSDTDTSSGADAESLAATMTDTDTATAVDAESSAAAINDTDTGTANDLEVSVSISDTDTGIGADNEALSLSDTEVGSGTDLDLGIAITDDETATTVDLGTIAAAVDDIEAGNSLDTESLTALIADLETAFGDDDGLIAAAVGSSDIGVGVDAESVFKTSDPVVIEPTSATLVTQGTTSGALLTEATAGALLT